MPAHQPPVLTAARGPLFLLTLNRPRALNSLNLEMIRLLRRGLETALRNPAVRLVVIRGAGDRGFCAGGDIKALAAAVAAGRPELALQFFREEYDLDLALHESPRPVAVLAAGICMGGGLGLAAAADLVAVTSKTRMAMPETRIGFFPDVGASGWLHLKCPPGYPEFLGLSGYEMAGAECVRLGLATHLVSDEAWPEVEAALAAAAADLPDDRPAAAARLRSALAGLACPARPDLDAWVQAHFARPASLPEVLAALARCRWQEDLCAGVFQWLAERSPTAVALTWELLRRQRGRPLAEVFATDFLAARFMIGHPDYLEGIRARLLDRDNQPRWQPASLPDVRLPLADIFPTPLSP